MKREADRVVIDVDVEKAVKAQRSHIIVRERLQRGAVQGLRPIRTDSRYLLTAVDGSVVATGVAKWDAQGRFVADLPEHLPRGRYLLLVGIYLDGNAVNPAARALSIEVDGS